MDEIVEYVTPDNSEDVLALVAALQAYGATGISVDSRSTSAIWPTKEAEQAFEKACEEAQA